MSASPIPYDVSLPDGSTITLVLQGDEFEHYERDLNGTSMLVLLWFRCYLILLGRIKLDLYATFSDCKRGRHFFVCYVLNVVFGFQFV
jgi:hypothetical protein